MPRENQEKLSGLWLNETKNGKKYFQEKTKVSSTPFGRMALKKQTINLIIFFTVNLWSNQKAKDGVLQ